MRHPDAVISGSAFRLTPFARTAYGVLISTVSGTVLGSMALLVAARLYSSRDIGEASAVIALATFVGAIGSLGLGTGLLRFLPQHGANGWSLIRSAYGISAALTVVVATGGLVVVSTNHASGLSGVGMTLFLFGAVANGMTMVQDGVLISTRRSRLLVGRVITAGTIRLLTVIALAPIAALGFLASWTLSVVGPLLVFLRFGPRADRPPTSADARVGLRQMIGFSAGNYVLDIAGAAAPSIMPLAILTLSGPAESAYFTIPQVAAMLVYAIGRSAAVSLFAEAAREGLGGGNGRAIVFGVGQIAPIVIATWLLASPVLSLLGAEYAEHADWPLRLLVLSALPNAIASPYIAMRRVQGKFVGVLAVIGTGTIGTFASAAVLIPQRGAIGAAVAILVGQGLIMLLVVFNGLLDRRSQSTRATEPDDPSRLSNANGPSRHPNSD